MADGDGTGFDSGLAVRRVASPPMSPRRGATNSGHSGIASPRPRRGVLRYRHELVRPRIIRTRRPREAIEEERCADVDRYAALTAALDAYADKLDEGVRLMGEAGSAAHGGWAGAELPPALRGFALEGRSLIIPAQKSGLSATGM